MENVWARLPKDVYGKEKSYNRVSDLKEAIVLAWERLLLDFAANFNESMQFLMSSISQIIYKYIINLVTKLLKINAKDV